MPVEIITVLFYMKYKRHHTKPCYFGTVDLNCGNVRCGNLFLSVLILHYLISKAGIKKDAFFKEK